MEAPPPDGCEYPSYSGDLALGEVIAPARWNGVYADDGTQFDLDLQEFHCSEDYARYDSMVLVVSAGWCGACPEYISMMNGLAQRLEDNGTMLVYLEAETSTFDPATSLDAKTFIEGIVGADALGVRAGDADNTMPDTIRPQVTRMPSAYFIRKRDMVITADQAQSQYFIDWPALAADPEGTWTPALPPFVSNCDPSAEESLEPNDSQSQAALIEPGEVEGGICMAGTDFYRVNLPGAWRFSMYTNFFMYDNGNLDLRLYSVDGERIGGSTQRANHDWIDYEGPALVEIYGDQNASNTYRVELIAR